MSQLFQISIPSDAHERCAYVVRRWLAGCSQHACYWRSEAYTECTDEQLADACIAAWGLDQPQGDENDVTWFEIHGADRSTLIQAFTLFRSLLNGT